MRMKPQFAALIALAIFIAGIGITSLLGVYSTETQKNPAKLDLIEYDGQYDPADIRGSFTFVDISGLYGVPIEDLAAAFGQDARTAEVLKCKDIESIYEESAYEIGTASMRLFVAYYTGLPYTPTSDEYLPETAVAILVETGNLSSERAAYLESHTVKTD